MNTPSQSRPIAIIAEDEDLGRLLLTQSAQSAGLATLEFDNGLDALQAAETTGVAIVLLDVDMPGMDGYTVCRRIRESGKLGTVPIVMVTGHEDTAAINRAFEAGATDYISKPVNWALLPHRLAYILRNAASAAHIERLAYFDSLTGLPNRQRCLEVGTRLLAAAEADSESVAVIYANLNGFKRINDTFGHSIGDSVLKTVAVTLDASLSPFASQNTHLSLSRWGGDEFLILVQSASARSAAIEIANAICSSMREPVNVKELDFFAAPNVGVAVFPEDGADFETLLKHADTAMYHAKMNGVASIAVYNPSMSARLRDWLELESKLRRAVKEGALTLRFQPKIRLSDGSLAGVEALIRWFDPEAGDIAPGRFVPVAEETGLIIEMGAWTIKAACRQLRAWLDRGIQLPIAINVSGKELSFGDPASVIAMELARYELPANLLEVEITESIFVNDAVAGRTSVQNIRNLGCRIALDDFGTGYSSLAYLSRFPPDRLKIDRSFVQSLDRSESDAAIVAAILSLADSLNLIVTAEGVERPKQLEWLKLRGCHEAQGYLLARPLSADQLEKQFFDGACSVTGMPRSAIDTR